MKTRSPKIATPRLIPPAASPDRPVLRGRSKCQISRPFRASRAYASFTAVTYITPSTTTGVVSSLLERPNP